MLEFKNCKNKKELVANILNVGNDFNEKISNINSLNTDMLSAVEKTASYGQSLTDGLKVIANQISDIMILDGYLAKSITPFENVSVELTNMIIDKDTLTMRIANKK